MTTSSLELIGYKTVLGFYTTKEAALNEGLNYLDNAPNIIFDKLKIIPVYTTGECDIVDVSTYKRNRFAKDIALKLHNNGFTSSEDLDKTVNEELANIAEQEITA